MPSAFLQGLGQQVGYQADYERQRVVADQQNRLGEIAIQNAQSEQQQQAAIQEERGSLAYDIAHPFNAALGKAKSETELLAENSKHRANALATGDTATLNFLNQERTSKKAEAALAVVTALEEKARLTERLGRTAGGLRENPDNAILNSEFDKNFLANGGSQAVLNASYVSAQSRRQLVDSTLSQSVSAEVVYKSQKAQVRQNEHEAAVTARLKAKNDAKIHAARVAAGEQSGVGAGASQLQKSAHEYKVQLMAEKLNAGETLASLGLSSAKDRGLRTQVQDAAAVLMHNKYGAAAAAAAQSSENITRLRADRAEKLAEARTIGNTVGRTAVGINALREFGEMMTGKLDPTTGKQSPGLIDALPSTQYPLINEFLMAGEKGIGDSRYIAVEGVINSIVQTYSKMVSPTGGSVEDRRHVREVLRAGMAKGQLKTAIHILELEGMGEKRAAEQAKTELIGQSREGGASPAAVDPKYVSKYKF